MQAGVVRRPGGEVPCRAHPSDPFGHCRVPLGVDLAGPTEVAFEVATGDEVVDGPLHQLRRLDVARGAQRNGMVGEFDREDGVAETDRWRERLGERRHVDHPPGGVEEVEWLEWPIGVAVLGVVVVLDDRLVMAIRMGEQGSASGDGERGAGGRLVRWGGVHDAGVCRDALGPDARCIDGDERDSAVEGLDEPPHRRVAGFLDGDDVTGACQQADGEVDRGLRPGGDHDLLGIGHDTAGAPGPTREGLAEFGQPTEVAIARRRLVRCGEHGSAPCRVREEREVGRPGAQVESRLVRGHEREIRQTGPRLERRWGGTRRSRRSEGAGGAGGVGDEGTRGASADHVTLGGEPRVDGCDRLSRDTEVLGEPAGRRQALAGGDAAGRDGGADLFVERAGDGPRLRRIDEQFHRCQRPIAAR